MEELQYPIGKFEYPQTYTAADIQGWINEIESVPVRYKAMVESLTEEHLNMSYRPGGWTARQVIHHVPDSHLQAYCRFKWVLTEDSPTIKPYHEDLWAQLPDSMVTPVSVSIDLLTAVHTRWVLLMRSMTVEDFNKYYIHPQYGKQYALGAVCKLYAWHGNHHLAHLQIIRNK